MKLATNGWAKPIPTRIFDWTCFDSDTYDISGIDGETGQPYSDCPVGYGADEFEAIVEFVRELLLRNDDAQEMLVNCWVGASKEEECRWHSHTCQQCDKIIGDVCDCKKGNTVNMWCSARCKAAFDL